MSWIWILPALLVTALAGVFYPVFSRRGGAPLPAGLEGDPGQELTAQRDGLLMQIKEIELEGVSDPMTRLTRASLEQELAELLTRLDALAPKQPLPASSRGAITAPPTSRSPLDLAMAIVAMLCISLIVGVMYLLMGTPREIAPASGQALTSREIATMVEQAAQRLKSTPDDIPGWMRLARSYVVMDRPNDAMTAYAHILTRQPDSADAIVALGELELQSPDPTKNQGGIDRLQALLTKHPDHPEALWLLGGAAFRVGDRSKALGYWNQLKTLLPPGSQALQTVEQAIAQAGAP
ncbi:MAG: tetratricopeptide repeat protein [Magnetococcales bacterium]|nr:tetratricopeptide repeat protein [Magnetococcales bacterium]